MTIDSTGIVANSAWPIDGKTLIGLIERIYRVGRKLNRFGLVDFVEGHLPRWIGEMNTIEFEINLVGGKKGANRKRRNLYGKLLKKGGMAVNALQKEFAKKAQSIPVGNMLPSQIQQTERIVGQFCDAIARTGVLAVLVSSDDGYSSKTGKEELEGIGIGIVSISGSKGKKITDPEEWDSEPYREARNDRSAVESLMFTLKDGFEFGRLSRRGIDAVRSELTGKVLAYNFCRKIEIRKRQAEQLRLAG